MHSMFFHAVKLFCPYQQKSSSFALKQKSVCQLMMSNIIGLWGVQVPVISFVTTY